MTFIVDGTSGLTFPNSTVQASAGSVLQVISTTKTDAFTTTSTSFVDITNLSVSITPKFSTSKIFVIYTVSAAGIASTSGVALQILRDATAIGIGTTATGSQYNAGIAITNTDNNWSNTTAQQILDYPATTSSVTYKIQCKVGTTSSSTAYINRTPTDGNNAYTGRFASSITVMEVAG